MRGFISGLSILFHWSIFLSLCQYLLSSWLWLCSRAWSQAGWFLQFHFSFSRLLWLFEIFCISMQIVKLFVLGLHYIFLKFYLFFNWRLYRILFSVRPQLHYILCAFHLQHFSAILFLSPVNKYTKHSLFIYYILVPLN